MLLKEKGKSAINWIKLQRKSNGEDFADAKGSCLLEFSIPNKCVKMYSFFFNAVKYAEPMWNF